MLRRGSARLARLRWVWRQNLSSPGDAAPGRRPGGFCNGRAGDGSARRTSTSTAPRPVEGDARRASQLSHCLGAAYRQRSGRRWKDGICDPFQGENDAILSLARWLAPLIIAGLQMRTAATRKRLLFPGERTMKSKITLTTLALLALSTLSPESPTAFAQGTAFTYQGRLNNSGGPANGSVLYAVRGLGCARGGQHRCWPDD